MRGAAGDLGLQRHFGAQREEFVRGRVKMPRQVKPVPENHAPVPSRRRRGTGGRVLALLLAVISTAAFAQQAVQDTTRSLHEGTAAQAARIVSQPEASQNPAPGTQTQPQAEQDATRGVPAGVATQAAIDALHPEAVANRGVLYRVTAPTQSQSPPAGQVGYLFGTIHFGTPEEQGVDYGKLSQLLGSVQVYANEADVDSRWDARLDGYRWLPAQTTLAGLLGTDAMAKAHELLPDVAVRDLQRMRPWMVLALLEARGERGSQDNADIRLQRIASGMGKQLQHLEALEDQLRALDCVPPNLHAQVLSERLQKPHFLELDSALAMAAYRARNLDVWLADVDHMDGLSDAAKRVEQRSRLCLLEDRNARWIGQIEALYRREPALVAVGALHLPGPNGLVARLRRDGFKVEEVPF